MVIKNPTGFLPPEKQVTIPGFSLKISTFIYMGEGFQEWWELTPNYSHFLNRTENNFLHHQNQSYSTWIISLSSGAFSPPERK